MHNINIIYIVIKHEGSWVKVSLIVNQQWNMKNHHFIPPQNFLYHQISQLPILNKYIHTQTQSNHFPSSIYTNYCVDI